MNNLLIMNGLKRLPPGFRFQPTEEELVFQYLKCKTFSLPLPASIIPELNLICNFDPWDLPGELEEEERYFFSMKEAKYRTGNWINRATASGYWKATGVDKQIMSSRRNEVAGMRKTLVFHTGKPPRGTRTDWIMHEYRLVNLSNNDTNAVIIQEDYSDDDQMEKWVLCHVFLKKTSKRSSDQEEIMQSFCDDDNDNNLQVKKTLASVRKNIKPKMFNFMRGNDGVTADDQWSSSSSSSWSTDFTEVSSSACIRQY